MIDVSLIKEVQASDPKLFNFLSQLASSINLIHSNIIFADEETDLTNYESTPVSVSSLRSKVALLLPEIVKIKGLRLINDEKGLLNPYGTMPYGVMLDSTAVQAASVGAVETILFEHILKAGRMERNGQILALTAWGNFAANANNKTLRFALGSSSITLGPGAFNNNPWSIQCFIARQQFDSQKAMRLVVRSNFSPLTGNQVWTENLMTDLSVRLTGTGVANGDVTLEAGYLVLY